MNSLAALSVWTTFCRVFESPCREKTMGKTEQQTVNKALRTLPNWPSHQKESLRLGAVAREFCRFVARL
jgi:hypothetical protein